MTKHSIAAEYQAGRLTVPQFVAALQRDTATEHSLTVHRRKVAERIAYRHRMAALIGYAMPATGFVFLALVAGIILSR